MVIIDGVFTNGGEGHLPGEAKKLLKSLASSWSDGIDSNTLQVIPLKGGLTNKVFQINWLTETGELQHKVLLRLYGVGAAYFFDRDNEIRTFEFMSRHGQGPRLLGRFSNGRIEEFIHARTLSAGDLRDPDISALIAAKLREFHDLDMPGPKNVQLWDNLRNWLKEAQALCSPDEAKEFRLDALVDEILALERELSADHQRIAFCHNDTQYGNIMMDEDTRLITLIDYEFASYNPVAYDLAFHFCEMAANYDSEEPHILDYSLYPDLEERQRFVYVYLSSSGNEPSSLEVEQLLEDVEKYTLANDLFGVLWAIISEHVNEIDFQNIEYGRQRFQRYWLRKSTLLGYSGTSPV